MAVGATLARVQLTLLGPVSAQAGGTRLPLGSRKQRAVFALLALNANRTVSLDRLMFEVWRDEPPARAWLALQAYISRLRRECWPMPAALHGSPPITPGWDSHLRLARSTRSASSTCSRKDGPTWALLGPRRPVPNSEPRGLWTGDPLADLNEDLSAMEDAARLHEARLETTDLLLRGRPRLRVERRGLGANPRRSTARPRLARRADLGGAGMDQGQPERDYVMGTLEWVERTGGVLTARERRALLRPLLCRAC